MGENSEGFGRRIDFFRQTRDKPREKARMLGKIALEGKAFARSLKPAVPELQINTILRENREFIRTIESTAKVKLHELGFSQPEQLIPAKNQLAFGYAPKDDNTFNRIGNLGEFMQIELPYGTPFAGLLTKHMYFHELSHFITRRVIKVDKNSGAKKVKLRTYSTGFTRFSIFPKAINPKDIFAGRRPRGIFEEGFSDLFALYCIDEEVNIETPYNLQVPFMIALINRYAQARGMSPLEAFKKAFRAKAERDFTLQKELIEVFGTQTVKDLNNVELEFSHIHDPKQLEKVAQEGGFFAEYVSLRDVMDQGKPLKLEGMKGGIVVSDGATDWIRPLKKQP